MKVYLVSTANLTSEKIPQKYQKYAQKEECFYRECIPTDYITDPAKYGWPADVTERFKTGVEKFTSDHTTLHGRVVNWTSYDYPGTRHYLQLESIEQLQNLITEFGGRITFHKRGLENSSRLFEEPDCECLLGSPDIGDAIVMEIEDDRIEQQLIEYDN
jgi:hypothetical protein